MRILLVSTKGPLYSIARRLLASPTPFAVGLGANLGYRLYHGERVLARAA
jgi:hypothetical protein